MDKPTLTIELPELDIKAVVLLRNFIESFLFEFDAHYFNQLREYYRTVHLDEEMPF